MNLGRNKCDSCESDSPPWQRRGKGWFGQPQRRIVLEICGFDGRCRSDAGGNAGPGNAATPFRPKLSAFVLDGEAPFSWMSDPPRANR